MEPWCWVRPDTSHKYQVNHGSHSVLEIETKMQGSCETCLLVCSLRLRTITHGSMGGIYGEIICLNMLLVQLMHKIGENPKHKGCSSSYSVFNLTSLISSTGSSLGTPCTLHLTPYNYQHNHGRSDFYFQHE